MKKTLPTLLDYYNGTNEIPTGTFRISPSQVSKFFSNTSEWYRTNLLGEDASFTSSTSSVLGTCVHYVCERYGKTQQFTDADKQEVAKYIEKHTNPEYEDFNPEIDKSVVETQYKIMATELVNQFLSSHIPTNVEDFLHHEILPDVFVGGSCDYYDEKTGTVLDWKTTSTLTAPKTISYPYRLQLLCYAWLYRQQGKPVNRIQIAYVTRAETNRISEVTQKRLKDYPSTISILSESISETDLEFIESILNLIAHSVQTFKSNPELQFLLAQDWRLRA